MRLDPALSMKMKTRRRVSHAATLE